MIRRLKEINVIETTRLILSTATFRQTGITFASSVVNGALGALFYIVGARVLGPASFGLMSVAIVVLTFMASIGSFGINTGLVKFVGEYLAKDKTRAERFLKLALEANLIVGLIILVLGLFAAENVSVFIFNKPELAGLLRISSVGVLFMLLFSFATGYLQSYQKFWSWGLLQIGTNLARVVVTLTLFVLGVFTLQTGLWVYALMPLLGFLIAIIFILPQDFIRVNREVLVAKEFFHYNKWVAGFVLVSAFSSRIDTFIAARLLNPADIGLYSAANQLVYIVPQIIGALGTVMAPKMAGMGKNNVVSYLKKTQFLVLGMALLGLLAAPVVAFFVPYIFGAEYIGATPPFFILLLAMLIFLISVPIHNVIIYHFGYPKLFFYLAIGHLLIVSFFGWFLISAFGIMGAALTVLVGSTFNFVVPMVWVVRRIKW